MSESATVPFVQQIVTAVPELKPVLQEHLDDNFDDLLPHVFFGDVTRWAEKQTKADPDNEPVQRLLARLEEGLANGSPEVKNLITVSFVENVDDDSPLLERLSQPLLQARE